MKDQLKKIFSDLSASFLNTVPLGDTIIKTEETCQLECESDKNTKDVLYSQNPFDKDRQNRSTHQNKKKN